MALRPRKLEIDAMSTVLDSEGILEDMAANALVTAFDMLLRRELWVVVTQTAPPERMVFVHGPYFTRRQAEKAIETSEIAPRVGGVMIRRLITSTSGDDSD